jgi:hypothetical protein
VKLFSLCFWNREKVFPPAESEEDDAGNGKGSSCPFRASRAGLGSGVNAPPRGARVGGSPLRGKRDGRESKSGSGLGMCWSGLRRRWLFGEGSVESGEADDDGGGGPGGRRGKRVEEEARAEMGGGSRRIG